VFRRSTGDAALRDLCGELDATKLAKSPFVKKFRQALPLVIWFQCPWTFLPKAQQYSTAELLSMFMDSVFTLHHPGGIVLVIGVVTTYAEKTYRIQDLKKAANAKGFKHFEDKNLIRECIAYGYRHCIWNGRDKRHDEFRDHHLSHVFVKEKESTRLEGE
jgi:hypothetical protein